MAYKIIVSPIALKNIDNAVEYYIEQASKKVALAFLDDYQKVYKALQKNPFYQFHDSNYRYLPFKKFPYIAFFILDEPTKTVFLNAVFNTHQNPDKIEKLYLQVRLFLFILLLGSQEISKQSNLLHVTKRKSYL